MPENTSTTSSTPHPRLVAPLTGARPAKLTKLGNAAGLAVGAWLVLAVLAVIVAVSCGLYALVAAAVGLVA